MHEITSIQGCLHPSVNIEVHLASEQLNTLLHPEKTAQINFLTNKPFQSRELELQQMGSVLSPYIDSYITDQTAILPKLEREIRAVFRQWAADDSKGDKEDFSTFDVCEISRIRMHLDSEVFVANPFTLNRDDENVVLIPKNLTEKYVFEINVFSPSVDGFDVSI